MTRAWDRIAANRRVAFALGLRRLGLPHDALLDALLCPRLAAPLQLHRSVHESESPGSIGVALSPENGNESGVLILALQGKAPTVRYQHGAGIERQGHGTAVDRGEETSADRTHGPTLRRCTAYT